MRIATAFLAALSVTLAAPARAAGPEVEDLAWLAGCWAGQFGEAGTVEQWLPPAGGTMLGMSRTVKQGRTVEFEFMQLRRLPEGEIAFIPQPAGRPPTTFRLTQFGAMDAVFENPAHDFPQKIRYTRPDPSRLVASIEGQRNGNLRRIEFNFTRSACDAPGGASR